MTVDVVVIGGGSSGLMASIAARKQGATVLLVDKGKQLGRKLGISGGGRCNVTNAKPLPELIQHIPGNGRFLYGALTQFGNRDIVQFFERLGIRLKEEDHGRMFPVTDKAKTVVDAFVQHLRQLGVTVRTDAPVAEVLYADDGCVCGVRLCDGEVILSRCVIVAVGGKSVPYTGSTGDGYAWAIQAGHTITTLFPTEVPITSDEPFIQSKQLQGLSFRDVALTVWNPQGKVVVTHIGDLIITHVGLSGPIALRCSQFVGNVLRTGNVSRVRLTLNLFPDDHAEHLVVLCRTWAEHEPKKALKNVLKGHVSERMIPLIIEQAGLTEEVTYAHVSKQGWRSLARVLQQFVIHATGTLSIEEAFITGGGVHVKEVDPKTMQSKRMSGLYFCGEVLDIHAYTGGYNITAAFSTGHVAGTHAGETAIQLRDEGTC